MSNRNTIAVAGVIAATGLTVACAGVAGAWLASPYLAIHEIRSGARERDPDRIIRHIDFPALREDLKAQLIGIMTRKMQSDPGMAANPFSGLAAVIVVPMVNSMIDAYITPSGIKGMIYATAPSQAPSRSNNPLESTLQRLPSELNDTLSSASLNYNGFNRFVVTSKTDAGKNVRFKFNRSGFADWKLVSIELPPE